MAEYNLNFLNPSYLDTIGQADFLDRIFNVNKEFAENIKDVMIKQDALIHSL